MILKDREALRTLVESLVQMTCSDFSNFFKLAELSDKLQPFVMENSGKCTYLQKIRQIKVSIRLFCWKRVLYGKLGQYQKIREITVGHLSFVLGQSLNPSLCLD